MTYERWLELKNKTKSQFKVLQEGEQTLESGPGSREFIEFLGPSGKTRLELVKKPVILDKKIHYSKRIGSSASVEYVYDEKEQTLTLHIYTWDEVKQTWQELKSSSLIG